MSMPMTGVSACPVERQSGVTSEGRLTPNARIVLDTMRETGHPLKAYVLLENLRDRGINAPMTVYRALEHLTAKGLVRKIESLNAFIALPLNRSRTMAFIICRQCSKVRTENIDQMMEMWLKSLGVNIDDAYIEAYTDCALCSRQKNA